MPRNPFDPRYIPGGSSSGSAVAVAAGLVRFALGTDTAGSGRVPAAFNNIVGLKPTRGRISTRGVVPACRTLDCVSIFALTVDDAAALLDCAGLDAADPFSRARAAGDRRVLARRSASPCRAPARSRSPAMSMAPACSSAPPRAGGAWRQTGRGRPHALLEAARCSMAAPGWRSACSPSRTLYNRTPEALLPVTREIIGRRPKPSALDTFKASYRLAALRRAAEALWQSRPMLLLVPTAGTIYTLAEVAADPIRLNTRLGTYTNFVNLFDLAAVALPAGFRRDGLPFGVSCIAPAFSEAALLALGSAFQRQLDLPLGATPHRLPPLAAPAPARDGRVAVAVAGAHLSGMPLNGRLLELGASLVEETQTAPAYRMFRLDGEPARPGLLRDSAGGRAFAVELWAMSPAALGTLVAETAPPLSIGTVLLGDGRAVKGFLCEAGGDHPAEEISAYGGWREFSCGAGKAERSMRSCVETSGRSTTSRRRRRNRRSAPPRCNSCASSAALPGPRPPIRLPSTTPWIR